MSRVTSQISISIDGYVAGPNQSPENPLGEGGERLHDWVIPTEGWRKTHGYEGGVRNVDSEVAAKLSEGIGAHVMGRKMFAGPGRWDESWRGWWGDEPPFHAPVYVLTHNVREPLEMQGGTTFHFVNDGFASALEQARAAAGEQDVAISGGASTINQALAANALDELYLHIVPITLGGGERLFEDVGDVELAPAEVVASPAVTHIRYELRR
ncbi:MAG: dihydrofolate reductase family protein [Gaiellales bacterium]